MTFTVTRYPKTKKQRNQPSLPRPDGCKTRKDIKQCVPKTKTNTDPHKQCELHKTINQLQQNHSLKKRLNTSLNDLSLALTNHGRHGLFSFLSSLPISVLRNLELEANKLYDRANKLYKAALLTRCYVQHFLSPYIDSEVNHKRHFIKIPFINKGIEFIDLHSIFKDNSVISSIPNYFNNSETPIICYKYNKPIRSTIFNFNKIVNDLDIDSNTPAS